MSRYLIEGHFFGTGGGSDIADIENPATYNLEMNDVEGQSLMDQTAAFVRKKIDARKGPFTSGKLNAQDVEDANSALYIAVLDRLSKIQDAPTGDNSGPPEILSSDSVESNVLPRLFADYETVNGEVKRTRYWGPHDDRISANHGLIWNMLEFAFKDYTNSTRTNSGTMAKNTTPISNLAMGEDGEEMSADSKLDYLSGKNQTYTTSTGTPTYTGITQDMIDFINKYPAYAPERIYLEIQCYNAGSTEGLNLTKRTRDLIEKSNGAKIEDSEIKKCFAELLSADKYLNVSEINDKTFLLFKNEMAKVLEENGLGPNSRVAEPDDFVTENNFEIWVPYENDYQYHEPDPEDEDDIDDMIAKGMAIKDGNTVKVTGRWEDATRDVLKTIPEFWLDGKYNPGLFAQEKAAEYIKKGWLRKKR